MQGAGGVGGLISSKPAGAAAQFACYDGNGNVVGLVDGSTGSLSANYEYGPFGETIRVSGTQATANPVRFSSKYQDDQTGFLYYGYRYYNPNTGRWPNRDPIGERGFNVLTLHSQKFYRNEELNLYQLLGNNPINRVDFDGRGDVPGGKTFLVLTGGLGAIEMCTRLYACLKLNSGEQVFIRTPVSIGLHLSALALSVGQAACGGPYTVRTRIWKDESDTCHDAVVVICLGVEG
jgi:RHS repeat-associated protein